jgi:hypothetical protein
MPCHLKLKLNVRSTYNAGSWVPMLDAQYIELQAETFPERENELETPSTVDLARTWQF